MEEKLDMKIAEKVSDGEKIEIKERGKRRGRECY